MFGCFLKVLAARALIHVVETNCNSFLQVEKNVFRDDRWAGYLLDLTFLDENKEKTERQECYDWAEKRAIETIKYRYEDLVNKQYKKLSEERGYLRDDLDKFYEDCLSSNGLQK